MDGNDGNSNKVDEMIAYWQEHYPDNTFLRLSHSAQNFTDEDWAKLGQYLSKNKHFTDIALYAGALNDQTMSYLFRGITSSNAIESLLLYRNQLSVAGVRSMVPFLQNTNNLIQLDLNGNNIQSEGFNIVLMALRNSHIESLHCMGCGIESIEIDSEHSPKHLEMLTLNDNDINSGGCLELAKFLQGEDSALTDLCLDDNKIDDEGVGILVDALRNNMSLETLELMGNDGISKRGQIMLLKLVNDISSIKATLQSNHTLKSLTLHPVDASIERNIDMATSINIESNPDAAGRMKMIQTQLESARREELAELQGISHSLYSEINPLHLPEVLALIGRRHGQGELYLALSSSIMTLLSTVNMKKYIQQERAYYMSKVEELDAKLASMEKAATGDECDNDADHRRSKVESDESRRKKRLRK